jgi:hypothetical protein
MLSFSTDGAVVIRLFIALPLIVSLCALSAAGLAQDNPSPAPANPSLDAPAKAHAKKNAHNSAARTSAGQSKQTSEDADKAARLAEGRKKFFERSMGFDNGTSSDSPVTLGGSGGLTPAVGLKF